MTRKSTAKRYVFEPEYAVPPGRTLQETIDALGMGQRDLATRAGLSAKHINQIIRGVATISHETAIRLEQVTGVSARMWNNLEVNYREQLAKLEEKKRLEHDLAWLKKIPTGELIKRGKIEKQTDRVLMLKAVLGFFGVADVEAWNKIWLSPTVAYRKSAVFQGKPEAMATWLRLGELAARAVPCAPFDKSRFRSVLHEIRAITLEKPEVSVPKMKGLCADAGVAMVLVPEIRNAPVSGATRWLTPEKAMLQLSLRYKTNDQFWFTFFHEAGHILCGGKKEVFIDLNHATGKGEMEADSFAADHLIPPRSASELNGLKSTWAIEAFAESIGIAPGIVVGRLQHEGMIGHDQFNGLKMRYQWAQQ
ncbi:HigA family addiction module antitoxin [Candidatus Methylomirabilis sp.]|uniref:HigA family addiction module antitoxin n=1 Tax=Candidatus Methylomirabilis sp. TaxID=2032687 RepID=UPI002A5DC206|nr:HigA family addiction module antitoxin [Candidatus Methylomirabilis sp.]